MLSKKVRRLLRWLRVRYPSHTPVVVRSCRSLKDCHGICVMGEGRAIIRLSESDPDTVQCDTLLEEWSHLKRWDAQIKCNDDHDQIFWAILGQITNEWRET